MVMPLHVVERDVATELDVAVVAEARIGGDPVVGFRHGLDFLMVWRHATANESERRRQSFEHVDFDDVVFLFE